MHIEALRQLITENKKPGMRVAEIGVYQAETSMSYLPIIKEVGGHAFLIDWFKGNEGVEGPYGSQAVSHDNLLKTVKQKITAAGFEDCVTIIDALSWEGAALITDASLDLAFIDADHRYVFVKRDISAYLPKVKSGGILCGHDCEGFELVHRFQPQHLLLDWLPVNIYPHNGCHPGVIQAVYEAFGVVELRPDATQPVWVYRKP